MRKRCDCHWRASQSSCAKGAESRLAVFRPSPLPSPSCPTAGCQSAEIPARQRDGPGDVAHRPAQLSLAQLTVDGRQSTDDDGDHELRDDYDDDERRGRGPGGGILTTPAPNGQTVDCALTRTDTTTHRPCGIAIHHGAITSFSQAPRGRGDHAHSGSSRVECVGR